MKALKQKSILVSLVTIFLLCSASVPAVAAVYEDFESGYSDGAAIRLHSDWFTEASRTNPTTEDNVGLNGTWGLSAGSPIFTWVAHPFDWNTDLAILDKVIVQMDFQTDGSGHFDDDRIGWMISDTDDSSSHIFGIQLDPGGSGYCIEGYWDGVSAADKRPHIVDIPSLSANTWYRFRAEITKLTATSAKVDVSLRELDGSGNPVSVVASGSIADTAALGSDAPISKYFSGPIWPGYKNYSAIGGAADNAYFEIVTGPPPAQYTLDCNIVGNGSVVKDPDQPTYSMNDIVEVTAYPDSGWEFEGWSGDFVSTDNPAYITVVSDMNITATFIEGAPYTGVCEDFDAYSTGSNIGSHADWFDGGSGPVVTSGIGVGGSVGLAPASAIFTWTAYPFQWSAVTLTAFNVKADFQTDGSGAFDDDRVGWMVSDTSNDSDFIFGVQLDNANGHLRMESYWDHEINVDENKRVELADLDGAGLSANTWYQLYAEITKVTGTSAEVYAELRLLSTGAVVASGVIDDTSTLGPDSPDPAYFAGTMWPAYKNYQNLAGAADNACFEIVTGPPPVQYTISGNIVDSGGLAVEGVLVSADNSGGSDTTSATGYYELIVNENWSGTVTPTMGGYTFAPTNIGYTTVDSNQIDQNYVATMQVTPVEWTAYNDCVYDPLQDGDATDPQGQSVHYIGSNVTTYGIGRDFSGLSSGELIDQATGAGTGVTATLTESGVVVWQPDISTNWYGGYDPNVGTDAYKTFNNIADMTGVIYYGSSGWYVDLTFTGLDANKEYTFATSAARCNPLYADRNTIYSIIGADTYTNASTVGVNVTSEDEVWFNTGDNFNEGYVARWTGITASDGTFTVRATHHPNTNIEDKAYAFDVFMLETLEEQSFHFTVTADMRSSHTAFSNLCQAINDLVSGPGMFHISIGDIDETVQQNRDVIDSRFGP